jgi:hypothetical protein
VKPEAAHAFLHAVATAVVEVEGADSVQTRWR